MSFCAGQGQEVPVFVILGFRFSTNILIKSTSLKEEQPHTHVYLEYYFGNDFLLQWVDTTFVITQTINSLVCMLFLYPLYITRRVANTAPTKKKIGKTPTGHRKTPNNQPLSPGKISNSIIHPVDVGVLHSTTLHFVVGPQLL
jgi:hypothetical protein